MVRWIRHVFVKGTSKANQTKETACFPFCQHTGYIYIYIYMYLNICIYIYTFVYLCICWCMHWLGDVRAYDRSASPWISIVLRVWPRGVEARWQGEVFRRLTVRCCSKKWLSGSCRVIARYSQFHSGWHFRKIKAQISNVSFATFQWKVTFEIWALSFETAFENVTPAGASNSQSSSCSVLLRIEIYAIPMHLRNLHAPTKQHTSKNCLYGGCVCIHTNKTKQFIEPFHSSFAFSANAADSCLIINKKESAAPFSGQILFQEKNSLISCL